MDPRAGTARTPPPRTSPPARRAGRAIARALPWTVLAVLLGASTGLTLAAHPEAGTPVPALSGSTAPLVKSHVGLKWGQYQGSASHNGVSGAPGPSRPHVEWIANEGGGAIPVVGVGSTLFAAHYPEGSLEQVNLSNGAGIASISGTIEIGFPVAGSTDVFYAQSYTYGCGFFCSATSSEVVDYNYASKSTTWTWGAPSTQTPWYLTEANGYVFAANTGGTTLYGLIASTGALSWTVGTPRPIATMPTVGAGLVTYGYLANDTVAAVSYFNGSAAWSFSADTPVSSPAIAFASNHFFLGTQAGSVYDLRTTGKPLWAFHSHGAAISTTPTVAGGTVYVAGGSTLYALNESTGKLRWKANLGGAATASPVASTRSTEVYVGDSSGEVTAINATGATSWRINLHAPVADGLILGNHLLIAPTVTGLVYALASTGNGTVPAGADASWGQYQGGAAHTGVAWTKGPTNGSLLWNGSSGSGAPGLTAVGDTLLAASTGSNSIEQWDLASHALVNGNLMGSTLQSTYGVQTSDNIHDLFVQYYTYGCGFFCTASGSEILDRVYNSSGTSGGSVPHAAGFSNLPSWALSSADGMIFLVNLGGSTLYALDAATLTTVWSVTLPSAISTIPAVGDGRVLVGFSSTAAVDAVNEGNGTVAWNATLNAPIGGNSASYSGGTFFVGSTLGTVYALSASSGATAWTYKDKGTSSVTTSFATTGGSVFFGSANGYVYDLNAANGSKNWITHIGGTVGASPVVASNGLLYCGNSNGILAALLTGNGTVSWKYALAGAVGDGLVLANGLLIAGDSTGEISVF